MAYRTNHLFDKPVSRPPSWERPFRRESVVILRDSVRPDRQPNKATAFDSHIKASPFLGRLFILPC